MSEQSSGGDALLRETMPPSTDEKTPPVTRVALGARLTDPSRCEFRVWAPYRQHVELHIVAPAERRVPMAKTAAGYHEAAIDDCAAGAHYFFSVEEEDHPDPASRFQPEGVHGPSEVVPVEFEWHDRGWRGVALDDFVIYELHVGTFSDEGTFEAVIPHLDSLRDLGVTAVELLPVAQFPGARNWGYDGAYVGAAQNSYGGPIGLKRLVDACHERGLALVLDVVYNHLGPEGNYLSQFAPYFTDRYRTPWGLALNFDGPHSDDVRWYFIHNALQWVDEFHVDALRVDAVHAIVDHSAEPFLQDLTTAIRERGRQLGREIYTIAESDLNDPRVITSKEELGLGFDSQWSDDFHHSLHALLTGERDGYYEGFGRVSDLARVMKSGYSFIGQHSVYRGRKYGAKPKTADGRKFVVCAQNHDQVGNRMLGDRLAALVSYDKLKIAAAALVLSPFIPMLFMGEEHGETAPFQYFTSHSDEDLIEAVRKGRREEFEDFDWRGEPPDPHDEETFRRSKVQWHLVGHEQNANLRKLYRELLRLRRERPALRKLDLASLDVHADDARRVLLVRRWSGDDQALIAFNFGDMIAKLELPSALPSWDPLIETGARIDGREITLPPASFALFGV
jgi:maltooligosyltrehalose trehalohydrolase